MNKKYILPVAAASLLMVSCADEFNPAYTSVEIPVDLAKIEELSGFAPLKENINRANHPGFKLGAALTASEFNKQLVVYNVGVTNFDEVVAGNAMKYASCVDGKGNMDFSTVTEFVNKADEAGISVYGHTLVWHSQQQPQYLNGLIADKPMPKPEGTMVDVEVPDYTIDWTKETEYKMWGAGGATAIDGGLKITNSKIQNFWECQYQVASGVPTVTGSEYVFKVVLKAQGDGDEVNLHYKLGDWSGGIEGSTTITANGEWQEFTKKGTATCDGSFLLIQFGDYIGDVTFKEITVSHKEEKAAPTIKDVEDYAIDWTKQAAYNMWGAGGATAIDGGLKITNSKVQNFWECQYQVASGVPTVKDSDYKFKVVLKAEGDGDEVNLHYKLGDWSGGIEGSTTIKANGEWQEFSKKGTATCDGSFLLVQFGDYIGSVTIKEVVVSHEEETQGGAQEVEKTFTEKKPTLVVTSQDMAANPWDTQFWILTDGWDAGSSYEFSAKIRADLKADASSQCHGEPGAYISGSGVGTLKFTQEWDTYSSKGTLADAGKSIAFNLNDQAKGTKYYFRDLSFKVNGIEMLKNGDLSGTDVSSFIAKEYPSTSTTTNAKLVQEITYTKMVASNTIPLTKEEKDSILSVALDRWIAGMMDACGGKVKAWDLANELISGGEQRVEDRYALQHGEEGDDKNFFWQDYLGDEDYVDVVTCERLEETAGEARDADHAAAFKGKQGNVVRI